MSINSGLREAPPTRKPSTSFWEASSLHVPPVTEPEKQNRSVSRAGGGQLKLKIQMHGGTDLRRWSSQSWPPPRIRWSWARPSAFREPPEPEVAHKTWAWLYKEPAQNVLTVLWLLLTYLLGGSSLAGANGPNRLIGEHDLAPVFYIVYKRDVW